MHKGFTLVEAILTIGVISIMMTLVFPHFTGAVTYQRHATEKLRLSEIKAALDAYAKENVGLPDQSTWARDLTPYSALSEHNIAVDTWGNPRDYRVQTAQRNFSGTSVRVDYAFVYSYGPDGNLGVGHAGVPGTLLVASGDFDNVDDYENLEADTNDHILKVSTYLRQVLAYEETIDRLTRFATALGKYADAKYHEEVKSGTPEDQARQQIYVPPSQSPTTDNGVYNERARSGVSLSPGETFSNTSTGGTRRTDMQNFARFLGLPESYCCSSLELQDGEEKAFYYYSNPRKREITGSCIQRPKLPARFRLEPDNCG